MEHPIEPEIRWDIQKHDGVFTAAAGDVVLILWDAPSRAPRIKWLFDVVEAHARRVANGVLLLQIIRESSSPPDAEGRAENTRGFKRTGDKLRKMVTVPVGDAIWTRLVRTVMRGMFLLQGKSDQLVVCARVFEGITELLKSAGPRTPARGAIDAGVGHLYGAAGLPRER